MSAPQRAFERLHAANPLTDTAPYQPSQADAPAFLCSIEEAAMTPQRLTKPPEASPRIARGWMVAAAIFSVVLAAGAVVVATSGGGTSPAATNAATSQPTEAPPGDVVIEEPEELAELRVAVNDGDALTAAVIHTGEGGCDMFFTTGVETCADS